MYVGPYYVDDEKDNDDNYDDDVDDNSRIPVALVVGLDLAGPDCNLVMMIRLFMMMMMIIDCNYHNADDTLIQVDLVLPCNYG